MYIFFCTCIYMIQFYFSFLVAELQPTSFTVSSVSSWGAEFTWSLSAYVGQAPDSNIQYSVTVKTDSQSASTVESNSTSVTVDGLRAGYQYTASIVTKLQQDGRSQSIDSLGKKSFTTNSKFIIIMTVCAFCIFILIKITISFTNSTKLKSTYNVKQQNMNLNLMLYNWFSA